MGTRPVLRRQFLKADRQETTQSGTSASATWLPKLTCRMSLQGTLNGFWFRRGQGSVCGMDRQGPFAAFLRAE
jgi:hypothetical protein